MRYFNLTFYRGGKHEYDENQKKMKKYENKKPNYLFNFKLILTIQY